MGFIASIIGPLFRRWCWPLLPDQTSALLFHPTSRTPSSSQCRQIFLQSLELMLLLTNSNSLRYPQSPVHPQRRISASSMIWPTLQAPAQYPNKYHQPTLFTIFTLLLCKRPIRVIMTTGATLKAARHSSQLVTPHTTHLPLHRPKPRSHKQTRGTSPLTTMTRLHSQHRHGNRHLL